jgi:phenylalanyl-tRNA synthetase beta chain
MTGARNPAFWSDNRERTDVSDLKGVVEGLMDGLGMRGLVYERRADPTGLFVESAEVKLGGKLWLGELGQLSPLLSRGLDLRDPVFAAEFNLDQLLARRGAVGAFKPLPAFPAATRDVAMVVAEETTHESVLQIVKRARAEHLEGAELFDVFRGASIEKGHKSLAYTFTYRHPERTLKDAEVNAGHERIVAALREGLEAAIRDQ